MIYLIIAITLLVLGGFGIFYAMGRKDQQGAQLVERLEGVRRKKKIEKKISSKNKNEKKDLADNLWLDN